MKPSTNTCDTRVDTKKRRNNETIFSKIDTKVQASKRMVDDIKNGQYLILPDEILNEETKKLELMPYSYDKKALLEKEYRFYTQNSTALGVLQTLNHHVEEEKKTKWEIFPTVGFSEKQLNG